MLVLFVVFLLSVVRSTVPIKLIYPNGFSVEASNAIGTSRIFLDKIGTRFYEEDLLESKPIDKNWAFCDNQRGYSIQFHTLNGKRGNQKCSQIYQAPNVRGEFFDLCGSFAKSCKELFRSNTNFPIQNYRGLACIGGNNRIKFNLTKNDIVVGVSGDCSRCSCTEYSMHVKLSIDKNSLLPHNLKSISHSMAPFAGCISSEYTENYSKLSFQTPTGDDIEKKLFETCELKNFPPPPNIPSKPIIFFGTGDGIGKVFSLSPITGEIKCLFDGNSKGSIRESIYKVIQVPKTNVGFFHSTNFFGWVNPIEKSVKTFNIPKELTAWSMAPAPSSPLNVAYAVANNMNEDNRKYYIVRFEGNKSSIVLSFEDVEGILPGYQKEPAFHFKKDLKTLYLLGGSGIMHIDISNNNKWVITRIIKFQVMGLNLENAILDDRTGLLVGIHPSVFSGNCSLGVIDPETGMSSPKNGDGVFISTTCHITSCTMVPGSSVYSCLSRGTHVTSIDINTAVLLRSGIIEFKREDVQFGNPRFIYYANSNELPVTGNC